MQVFREVRQHVAGDRLLDALQGELHSLGPLQGQRRKDALVSVLLRAGELECALADAASPQLPGMMQVTSLLAEALLCFARGVEDGPSVTRAENVCREITIQHPVRISPPEGFCFYALHPLDFADLLRNMDVAPGPSCVIGIRSIGTTLSAMVAAALACDSGNSQVERITVRPGGDYFERKMQFSAEESAFVRAHQQRSATFYVVDEGPGLSGSTFLAVGDALRAHGIPRERIVFLCSRDVDADDLIARDGAPRWRSYRSHHTPFTRHVPAEAGQPMHWGDWRPHIFHSTAHAGTPYENPENWPAVWMSAPKFLSKDGSRILKYEGLGRYGEAVRARSAMIAEAGYGPHPAAAGDGFTAYPFLRGTLLHVDDLSEGFLRHVAAYLAFRLSAFRVNNADASALESMCRHNYRQITGRELPDDLDLPVEHPVIADARMMPHEWLLLQHGDCRLMKLDAAAHGDDHFFPGPCDIACDLAGTIVEWGLTAEATKFFLDEYRKASGDEAETRVQSYITAYSAFHAGYSAMAANAMRGTPEETLHQRDYSRYAEMLRRIPTRQLLQTA